MHTETLQAYIQEKIRELERKPDEQEYIRSGRFNFGLKAQDYRHLPSWPALLVAKKKLVRQIWLTAFFLPLMLYAWFPGAGALWEQNWLRTLLQVLGMALASTLFYTAIMLFSLALEVNRVQRIIKKLLYEDLLEKISKQEATKEAMT